jgi:hypothetical protein
VIKNILNKIRGDAVDSGDIYAAHIIKAYNNTPSMSLIDMVKTHPGIIKYIQQYI